MTETTEQPQVPPIGTTAFEPGWHEGVPMERYLGDPAVSASKLWYLHEETEAHLLAQLLEEANDETPAKVLGSVTHTAVFEPGEFDSRYVVLGQCAAKKRDGSPCTNQGSVYRDGQSFCGVKGHDPYDGAPMPDGVQPIAASEKAKATRMRRSLFDHPTAGQLLRARGPVEVTGIFQDPKTGLWCRIRPDHLIEDPADVPDVFHWASVNLKSTGKSAAPHRFTRDQERLGLYFKAAFYRMGIRELWGIEPQHFYYPTVEAHGRHQVIVFRMNEDALDIGEAEVRSALDRLARAKKTGEWRGYGPEVYDLSLTPWRLKQVHAIDFLELDGGDVEEAAA